MKQDEKGGYWWECTNPNCDHWQKKPGIVDVIRDLEIGEWDQRHLTRACSEEDCQGTMRIAFYYKKSKGREVVLLQHVVGISYKDPTVPGFSLPSLGPGLIKTMAGEVPMMWEWTYRDLDSEGKERPSYFDFKRMDINQPKVKWSFTGITSLSRNELRRLFELYCERTGTSLFPW